MKTKKLEHEAAEKFIKKVETERSTFRKALLKDKNFEEIFDVTINREMFDDEEIVDIIEYAVNKKKILQDYKPTMNFI